MHEKAIYNRVCVFLVELVHLRKIRFLFVHFDCCSDFNVGIMCLCSIHSKQTKNSYHFFSHWSAFDAVRFHPCSVCVCIDYDTLSKNKNSESNPTMNSDSNLLSFASPWCV